MTLHDQTEMAELPQVLEWTVSPGEGRKGESESSVRDCIFEGEARPTTSSAPCTGICVASGVKHVRCFAYSDARIVPRQPRVSSVCDTCTGCATSYHSLM